MQLPTHKTKIVATLGPASESIATLENMIRAGMNVARLNFSHGEFTAHARVIANVRAAAARVGGDVTLMADLCGPKMRLGMIAPERIVLESGASFTLTIEDIVGDATRAAVSFPRLPAVVKPCDRLLLNDGLVQLEVAAVEGAEVRCRVVVGGELRSRKGLNLPGLDLGISAFTARDHDCLRFALEQGVQAVSQSFVESAADVEAVRAAAAALGHTPFIIAKIERARAVERIDEILAAADGIMIARGDLGVEVPIEHIAVLQKELVRKAVLQGKPVIMATQMLESMTHSCQPTRAEATDVANAVLDGSDCVMLSAESAIGEFPVEAVAMLARIAAVTEPHRSRGNLWRHLEGLNGRTDLHLSDALTLGIEALIASTRAAAVVTPTRTGATPRSITRLRLPVWILAPTVHPQTADSLAFSYGVQPIRVPATVTDWNSVTREQVDALRLSGDVALLVQGPSPQRPDDNHSIEFVFLRARSSARR